jgi:hypothetical protein
MAEIETPGCLAAPAKVPGASNRARRGIILLLHKIFFNYMAQISQLSQQRSLFMHNFWRPVNFADMLQTNKLKSRAIADPAI